MAAHKLAWGRALLFVAPAIIVTVMWLAHLGPSFDVAYVGKDGTGYRVRGDSMVVELGVSERSWRPAAGAFYTRGNPEPPPPGCVYIDANYAVSDWRTGNEVRRGERLFDVIPYPSMEDYSPTTGAQKVTEAAFSVPYWQLAALFLVPTGVVTARVGVRLSRSRHAARNNLCPVCAYDLRASAERCPECGTRINPTITEATKTATTTPSSAGRADAK